MKQYQTIDKVISVGQTTVNIPVAIIISIFALGSIILAPKILSKDYTDLGMIVGMMLGIISAWIWWSFRIVKWRIWAFQNTKREDWRELRTIAIKEQLIWPPNCFFEKTEFRTTEQNQIINYINEYIDNHLLE